MRRGILAGMLVVSLAWLGACGGGGSSGSVSGSATGIEIASQVSLVEAQEDVSLTLAKGLFDLSKALTNDTSTAYYTDPLNVWTYDNSMEALNIINEILCSLDQTQYATKVNAGDYVALVNLTSCDKRSDKGSDTSNQSSGADAAEYETWVVNSSRLNDSAPQIVEIWVQAAGTEWEPAMIIQIKATITEGRSSTNPNGLFRADIKMLDPTEVTTFAQGYLESVENSDGNIEFLFSMTGSGDSFPVSEAVHVIMAPDSTSGSAYTSHRWGEETGTYRVAYDTNNYLTQKESDQICLDRLNYDSTTFRYGVYGENGSRLELANPGFGVQLTSGENKFYGFAGYYGVWFPEEAGIADGTEVTRDNGAVYTVRQAPGKLVKHTKVDKTFADFDGDEFNYWDMNDQQNYIIQWDGDNELFMKTQVQTCDNGPCTLEDIADEVLILAEGQWYCFWRDGLGSICFEATEAGLSNDTVVKLDMMQTATAEDIGSSEITLYCFSQCLKPNLTSEQLSWMGDSPYYIDSLDVEAPFVYTIDPADMTLRAAEEPIAPVATDTVEGANSWGIGSGPMVDATVLAGLTDTWSLWGEDEYYTWETGPNDWNKYTGLVDSDGAAVIFDVPIKMQYTHVGRQYLLDYSGVGELNGIPWTQVDGEDMWKPMITIPNGSSATSGSTTYYIRALEMEQRMQVTSLSSCSGLTIDTDLAAPDTDYVDPAIGSMPEVTSDPAVIGGEVQ